MSGNPLVAAPVASQPSAFGGAYLLQDGADLATAIQSGNWVEGGVAAFSTALDTVAAVIDPIGTLLANGLGWVLDHIEPLRGWLQDLTGNASEVQAFAQTWANVSNQLNRVGGDLQHRLADLDGMSGETIDAYRAHVQALAETVASTGTWSGAVGSGLEIASTLVQAVYELVRDGIAQVVGTAISALITAGATLGLGTPVAIGQIVARVSSVATRVGRFIENLLASARRLMPLFDKLCAVLAKIFPIGRSHGGRPGTAGDLPRSSSVPPPQPSHLRGDGPPDGWRPLTKAEIDDLPVVRDGSHISSDGRTLAPDTWYQTGEHDYVYHTDKDGYIDRFHAEDLQLKDHEGRLRHDPDTPGKLPGDHAGHLAGDLFGGSEKIDNLVSQLSEHNLNNYRELERDWANALRTDPPGHVSVDVKMVTDETGRPTRFIIESVVNGELVKRTLRQ